MGDGVKYFYTTGWFFLVAMLVAQPSPAEQRIYRIVDENGNVMFTDAPPPDADEVELPPINTMQPEATAPPRPEPDEEDDAVVVNYRTLEILHPRDQRRLVIMDDSALSVRVRVEPALQQGHRLRLRYDGKLLSGLTIESPEPGTHTIVAEIVAGTGRVVKRSASVSFMLLTPEILKIPITQ